MNPKIVLLDIESRGAEARVEDHSALMPAAFMIGHHLSRDLRRAVDVSVALHGENKGLAGIDEIWIPDPFPVRPVHERVP